MGFCNGDSGYEGLRLGKLGLRFVNNPKSGFDMLPTLVDDETDFSIYLSIYLVSAGISSRPRTGQRMVMGKQITFAVQ